MPRTRRINLPVWLEEVAQDSNLSARDLLHIFGYATIHSLHQGVKAGFVPPHDWVARSMRGSPHFMWRVQTIREFLL